MHEQSLPVERHQQEQSGRQGQNEMQPPDLEGSRKVIPRGARQAMGQQQQPKAHGDPADPDGAPENPSRMNLEEPGEHQPGQALPLKNTPLSSLIEDLAQLRSPGIVPLIAEIELCAV